MEYHTMESREPREVEEAGCKFYSGAGQPDYWIDKIRRNSREIILFRDSRDIKIP